MILGVDLGSTKVALGLWKAPAERIDGTRFATPRDGPRALIAEIIRRGRELAGGEPIDAVGVSAGGPVDPERGIVLTIPNLPGWDDVPLAAELSSALGAAVAVENDANACALAEWRLGAGQGVRDLAFLTFSTGIGAGLILDGRLYRGSRLLAGEIGHHVIEPDGAICGCGGRGCLEAYASGAGIGRRLAELRQDDPSLPGNARELVTRARHGDSFSVEFLASTADYLARGLAGLIFLLNPARIILGTIAVGAGDLLLGPLRRELESRVWPSLLEGVEVLPAALGAELGDHAALVVAPHGE